jgi:hypothetical protein
MTEYEVAGISHEELIVKHQHWDNKVVEGQRDQIIKIQVRSPTGEVSTDNSQQIRVTNTDESFGDQIGESVFDMDKGDSIKVYTLKIYPHKHNGRAINHNYAIGFGEKDNVQLGLNPKNFTITNGMTLRKGKQGTIANFSNLIEIEKKHSQKTNKIYWSIIGISAVAAVGIGVWESGRITLEIFSLFFPGAVVGLFIGIIPIMVRSYHSNYKMLDEGLWNAINSNITEEYTKTGWNLFKNEKRVP